MEPFNSSPKNPPSDSSRVEPPTTAVQHEDPIPAPPPPGPKMRTRLHNTPPSGWEPSGKQNVLVRPGKHGMIAVFMNAPSTTSPKDELVESITSLKGFKIGKIDTSKDGLRAWTTFTGAMSKEKVSGLVVVRRIPKEADTPADVNISCVGLWPTAENAALTKELNTFVDGFKFDFDTDDE